MVAKPMGYGMEIPAHRVGGPAALWVKRVLTVFLVLTPQAGRVEHFSLIFPGRRRK